MTFTAVQDPRVETIVADALTRIAAAVSALNLNGFVALALGGGYARGEGGATAAGRPYNDLDFFVLIEPPESRAAEILERLRPVSEKFTADLGVDVDFTVRVASRLKLDERRLMVQEFLRGNVPLLPKDFSVAKWAGLSEFDGAEVPADEAARLLMNRGMGLLFAAERIGKAGAMTEEDRSFIRRNINKAILGAGDARLVARGEYAWRLDERAKRLGGKEYAAAAEWKKRPDVNDVKDFSGLWETARKAIVSAAAELEKTRGGEISRRSMYEQLRFMKRMRSFGRLRDFGVKGETRTMRKVVETLAARDGSGEAARPGFTLDSLMEYWKTFN